MKRALSKKEDTKYDHQDVRVFNIEWPTCENLVRYSSGNETQPDPLPRVDLGKCFNCDKELMLDVIPIDTTVLGDQHLRVMMENNTVGKKRGLQF